MAPHYLFLWVLAVLLLPILLMFAYVLIYPR
jgi:hypothetical protein